MIKENWIRAYEPRRVENLADPDRKEIKEAKEDHGAWGKLAKPKHDAGKYGSVKSIMAFGKAQGGKRVGFNSVVEVNSLDMPLKPAKAVARYFIQVIDVRTRAGHKCSEMLVKVSIGAQERETLIKRTEMRGKEMIATFREGFLFNAPHNQDRHSTFAFDAKISVVGWPDPSRTRAPRFLSRLLNNAQNKPDTLGPRQLKEISVGTFVIDKRVEANRKFPDGGHLMNGGRKVKDVVIRLQVGVVLDEERPPLQPGEGPGCDFGNSNHLSDTEDEEESNEHLIAISKPSGADLDFVGGHPGIIFRFKPSKYVDSTSTQVSSRSKIAVDSLAGDEDFEDDFSASQQAEWLGQILMDDKVYTYADSKEKAHEWAWAVSKWCPNGVLPEGYEEELEVSDSMHASYGFPRAPSPTIATSSRIINAGLADRASSPLDSPSAISDPQVAAAEDDDDEPTPRASPRIGSRSPPPIRARSASVHEKQGAMDGVVPPEVAVGRYSVSRPVGAGVPRV
ncbi:hypothetical protein M427DRAFT_74185 [Gonapodya prolifera JEL478]|uniref:C2 NT-type domain-containing protein n=1 Tax=Gonapodya prolifera (strain JEL478) TaxID=1344416 RepID=A0A139A0V1_GONPJ|nr:hypothetical protein M427DRAFT_74185 [Gonapodya prolifera JEL478]|eukprot:KXS10406.1 hypothetical protein M427DRAFT_74185 [Gonapodya prolifera JEL478]